jgi:hypothetical protein
MNYSNAKKNAELPFSLHSFLLLHHHNNYTRLLLVMMKGKREKRENRRERWGRRRRKGSLLEGSLAGDKRKWDLFNRWMDSI